MCSYQVFNMSIDYSLIVSLVLYLLGLGGPVPGSAAVRAMLSWARPRGLPLLGGDVVGDLRAVRPIVYQQELRSFKLLTMNFKKLPGRMCPALLLDP